ncbi:DNA adenine methylase [Ruminococcus flavefaciens]|uniref:DNA adenine methylase n=1 Tax=Ruminococcus flavefaciens TaxID=1265 RepID=UPI0026EF048A|nr:DNA adenine methylase [Ruminococcus flavefaciens]
MSWVGGKKSLRDKIIIRFPLNYGRYIEVFGGAGWVLFHKTPEKFEVFNDANSNLVNLYRCVRRNARKLIYKLMFMINARDDFRCIVQQRRRGLFARFRDYDRAAKFYYLIQYSYGHKTDQYCCKPVSMWKKFPLIERAAERLQTVAIENRDFEELIRLYDRPDSFFYCDPPYYDTESFYKDVDFTREDHIRLRNTLLECEGKFLVSYNDCPEIRELWDIPGIYIEEVVRPNNLALRYESGAEYHEVFISNYDTSERRNLNRQLSFLDDDEEGY